MPPSTYNVVLYYENHGVMVRLSETFQKGTQIATANQNGITAAALFVDNYKQTDISTAFDIGTILDTTSPYWPQITFDIINATKEKQRQYFQFSNATFTEYKPGATYMLGARFKF